MSYICCLPFSKPFLLEFAHYSQRRWLKGQYTKIVQLASKLAFINVNLIRAVNSIDA